METQNTIQFGTHYMLDGYDADPTILKDKAKLLSLLQELPGKMGMHSICEPVVVEVGEKNQKDPGGLSGFVMIAESHISFHTFPKRGFITIDVYTCQNDLDTNRLLEEFKSFFRFTDQDTYCMRRGIRFPAQNIG